MNTTAGPNRTWHGTIGALLLGLSAAGCASPAQKAAQAFVTEGACATRASLLSEPGDEALLGQAPACPSTFAGWSDEPCGKLEGSGRCTVEARGSAGGPAEAEFRLVKTEAGFRVDGAATAAAHLARQYFASDDCSRRASLVYLPDAHRAELGALKECKAQVLSVDPSACDEVLHKDGGRCGVTVALGGDKSAEVCVRREPGKLVVDLRCTEGLDGPDGKRALVKAGGTFDATHPEAEFYALEFTTKSLPETQQAWFRRDDDRPAMKAFRSLPAPAKAKLEVRPVLDAEGQPLPKRWWLMGGDLEGGHWESKAEPARSCGEGMAYVPGGNHVLGLDESTGKVTTSKPFCLDRLEVSTDQYLACVRSGRCEEGPVWRSWAECNARHSERGDHPVNCLYTVQASAYCAMQGKRLPTEDEWELAARGREGRTFPWGDAAPSNQLCWKGTSPKNTCARGSYPAGASPEGVQDLIGNVWEMTKTLHGGDSISYTGRGGSWQSDDLRYVRASTRRRFRMDDVDFNLGFRCAKALE